MPKSSFYFTFYIFIISKIKLRNDFLCRMLVLNTIKSSWFRCMNLQTFFSFASKREPIRSCPDFWLAVQSRPSTLAATGNAEASPSRTTRSRRSWPTSTPTDRSDESWEEILSFGEQVTANFVFSLIKRNKRFQVYRLFNRETIIVKNLIFN